MLVIKIVNSFVNPVLYFIRIDEFRSTVQAMLPQRVCIQYTVYSGIIFRIPDINIIFFLFWSEVKIYVIGVFVC